MSLVAAVRGFNYAGFMKVLSSFMGKRDSIRVACRAWTKDHDPFQIEAWRRQLHLSTVHTGTISRDHTDSIMIVFPLSSCQTFMTASSSKILSYRCPPSAISDAERCPQSEHFFHPNIASLEGGSGTGCRSSTRTVCAALSAMFSDTVYRRL